MQMSLCRKVKIVKFIKIQQSLKSIKLSTKENPNGLSVSNKSKATHRRFNK